MHIIEEKCVPLEININSITFCFTKLWKFSLCTLDYVKFIDFKKSIKVPDHARYFYNPEGVFDRSTPAGQEQFYEW